MSSINETQLKESKSLIFNISIFRDYEYFTKVKPFYFNFELSIIPYNRRPARSSKIFGHLPVPVATTRKLSQGYSRRLLGVRSA